MTPYSIIHMLCENGYNAHIVGGAVRDFLLDKKPKDIDIVTNAESHEIEVIFSGLGCKVNTVGQSFKICIVDGVEVATYRTDTYFGLDSKNCKIEKSKTINDDLCRRDFSINSMAMCSLTGDIIDDHGGFEDLKNKIIRFTGNPKDRIHEDPERILRACRFLAQIDGTFHPETFQALKDYSHYVKNHISSERIRHEILKAMKIKYASKFFQAMKDIDVLKYVFPSLDKCYEHTGGQHHNETVFEHCMLAGDHIQPKCSLIKLATYLHDVGKPLVYDGEHFIDHQFAGAKIVKMELKELTFSKDEIYYIVNLIKFHMRSIGQDSTPKSVRKFLSDLKDKNMDWKDWLRVKIADRHGNKTKLDFTLKHIIKIRKKIEKELFRVEDSVFSLRDLAIDGYDIQQFLGIKPGRIIGEILRTIFEEIQEDLELNTLEHLKQRVKEIYNGHS